MVTPGPANLLRLAFGRPEPELRHGDPLPPGWLCLYFLPQFPPDGLRPDGSPRDAGVVPPMPLPRRMFAGERLRWHRPIRIGDELRRETELADLTMKPGGTGTLVFATVVNRVYAPTGSRSRRSGAPCSARRSSRRAEPGPAARGCARRRPVAAAHHPDPVLLFRFSALTFNSHRIHYDRPWATEIEGYPGLVVHGPLDLDAAHRLRARSQPRARVPGYTTQARAPLFDTAPFELRGRPSGTVAADLWAVTPEGTVAMSAQVELA